VIKYGMGGAYSHYKLLNEAQFEALKATTRNFIDVSSLPPIIRGIQGYQSNYDAFYNEPIWVGPEYATNKDQEFYVDYTPERFVEFGKKTGMSPVRAQYFMKQVFTGSNLFASVLGEGVDAIALKVDPELHQNANKEVARTMANTPFIRRFVKTTSPYMNDDAKKIEGDRNRMKTINNRKLDEIMDSDMNEDEQVDAVLGFVEALLPIDQVEAQRIINRHHMLVTGQDITNNMFSWLMMSYDPAVRAELYHLKTKNLMPEQIESMDELSAEIVGLWSPSFVIRLHELRGEDNILMVNEPNQEEQ